jgi:hypothetical protein
MTIIKSPKNSQWRNLCHRLSGFVSGIISGTGSVFASSIGSGIVSDDI